MLKQGSKGISLDQQPKQEIDLKHRNLEQQPALPLDMTWQGIKQKLTLPLSKKRLRRSRKGLRWWLPLLLCVLLLLVGSVVTGRAAIGNWLSQVFVRNAAPTPVIRAHFTPTPMSGSSLVESNIIAKHFMDAMVQKNWTEMWSMLSPDAQQLWQGEKDFIHFEKAKFGLLKFVSYDDSSVQIQYSWRDPDTTQLYPDVATLRVSLNATAPHGLLTMPSSFALSKGLFNDTPFALVSYHGMWRVLQAGPADLDAPILVPASPPKIKLLVPIFMYHHISNVPTSDILNFNLTVKTTDFNAQLTWLQQQGYQSITQTELFDMLYYGKALPTHPMILTFDDGYEDMYTDALPVLLAHHFRGVFYIITGMIGGHYITWDQVRTLAQVGMQIGSHTIHHVNVGQPPAWTSTQKELLLSKETLEAQLGQPIQFFCYPAGEPFHQDPVYEQQKVLADLYADGYIGAALDPFSFDSAIQNAQTPYQLPRIRVSGGESFDAFIGILNFTLKVGA